MPSSFRSQSGTFGQDRYSHPNVFDPLVISQFWSLIIWNLASKLLVNLRRLQTLIKIQIRITVFTHVPPAFPWAIHEKTARVSNLIYSQLKRQVVQWTICFTVRKLFNTLHIAKINHEYHFEMTTLMMLIGFRETGTKPPLVTQNFQGLLARSLPDNPTIPSCPQVMEPRSWRRLMSLHGLEDSYKFKFFIVFAFEYGKMSHYKEGFKVILV